MHTTESPDFLRAYLQMLPLHRAIVRAMEARLYHMYASHLREPILDVGSGDGSFAQVVLPRAEIYGIDPLYADTHEATARQCYSGLAVASGASIPFHNGAFSSVICNCVLEHVVPLRETLAEISRVTARGGMFIATVVTDRFSQSLLGHQILSALGLPGTIYSDWLNHKANHHNLLSREGWAAAMEQVGFDVIEQVPYLGGRTMQIFDFGHYWALPNLAYYRLTGGWHLSDTLNSNRIWEDALRPAYEMAADQSGTCLFLLCRKR
ncbi:class I SAM-dependent methyltransferase [Chloroflexales bacterium ZM16-3]|nr:class I SAM-dependent methyltransferase [Chloroflexales bacterium ZM16-3]